MERTNAFVVKWQTRRNGDTFPGGDHQGISMDTKQRSSLIKNPGLIITSPLFKRKFSDFENMLNNNPPLVQKNFANDSLIFLCFFWGMKPDDIPLPQTIGDYNSRCRSHPDDPLFLFDNFVKLQLELVTVISFYILSKVKPVLTSVKNIQNEDFAKVSSNYGIT